MESMYRRLLNEESGKDRNAYLNFVSNLWTGS